MDTTLFSNLIIGVITLIVGAIATAAHGFISKHTTGQDIAILQELAATVVRAAEQQGIDINAMAVDKKEYAMTALATALNGTGVHFDPAVLDAAIEAAVYDAFNEGRTAAPTTTVTVQPEPTPVIAPAS